MWLLSSCTLYLSIFSIVKSTVDYLQHPVKSCHIGDTVENECNKCLCSSKAVFECTSIDCNSKITHNKLEETGPLCFPNQLYVKNLITCICTKDGKWPHKSCHDTFQSLPPRNVITHKCKPDTYIPIDCNVCRCGPSGEILNDRCTRNACEEDVHRRTNIASNTLYSKCEDKYWYSFAPCQFCFCVNQNKLVCNTGNYYTKNLNLGAYKLNTCGKDLIKEAIELIPDNLRMLRENSDLTNTSSRQKIKPLTTSKSNEDISTNQMAVEVNRESNDQNNQVQNIVLVNISSSNEYYSDESDPQNRWKNDSTSEPKLAPTTTNTEPSTRGVPITQMLDQDDYETVDASEVKSNEDPDAKTTEEDDSVDSYESKGMEVDFDQNTTNESPRAHFDDKISAYKYDGNTLQINVPKVLYKVFDMALRKSMVTLSTHRKCTPGSTTVHDCNMCFCLKNSKLLCTKQKCSGGKKA